MFWDSSALVPLILPEIRSETLTKLLKKGGNPSIWWATPIECLSAIHRRHRESLLTASLLKRAIERLESLAQGADTVMPSPNLRNRAGRLLAVHPLRAADALHLAAALTWCEENPKGEVFVCLDEKLTEAARREGFATIEVAGTP
jgi:hypothetical protein